MQTVSKNQPISSLHFESGMLISGQELDNMLVEALEACGGSGDQEHNVEYVMDNFTVTGNEEDCRNALMPYGAWEDHELLDHARNLRRLVWLAGCDLYESGEIYFE